MNVDVDGVRTLRQAHEVLNQRWPGRDASTAAWRAHHEFAATLYAHVAEVDPDHHHEALFWAGQEQEAARDLAQVAGSPIAAVPGEEDGNV